MSDEIPIAPNQIAERLSDFVAVHQTVSGRTEPDFIALGNALQGLYGEATTLTGRICQAVDLLGNDQGGVLTMLRRLAEESLEEFRGRRLAIGANLEAVRTIFDKTSSLINQTTTLSQIGLFLRVIGLNFNVEYAHISKSSTGMFSLMAQEVVKLADNISQVAEVIVDDCRSIQGSQTKIRSRIATDLERLASLSRDAEGAVASAVDRIEQIMGRAMAALREATGHSQTISNQVGELVMKIQLHDSMSQRIEHVVQALHTVITTLREVGEQKDEGEQAKILAGAWRIVALQCGQIQRIIDEVSEAGNHSQQSFQAIDQGVEALGQSFAALRLTDSQGLSQHRQGASSPLAHLQSSLSRLSLLMAEGSTMIEAIKACAGQVSTMVGRLTGHMRSIDDICFDLHLKAINAIIKAAALSDKGRTLNTLAQKTKALADEARDFVDQVTVIYQGIGQAAETLHLGEGASDAGQENCEVRLDRAVDDITATLSRFTQDAESCTREAEALRQAIGASCASLTFLPRLGAELTEQHGQLSAIAQAMAPWGGQYDDAELNEDALRLMQLYTTDQERELHAAFLGIPTAAVAATSATSESGLDEVFFFDEAAPPTVDSKKEDDLGDNVDLF